jgi:hypothetical protein
MKDERMDKKEGLLEALFAVSALKLLWKESKGSYLFLALVLVAIRSFYWWLFTA